MWTKEKTQAYHKDYREKHPGYFRAYRQKQIEADKVKSTPVSKLIEKYKNPAYKADEARWQKEAKRDYRRVEVSKNGSILPNRFACW